MGTLADITADVVNRSRPSGESCGTPNHGQHSKFSSTKAFSKSKIPTPSSRKRREGETGKENQKQPTSVQNHGSKAGNWMSCAAKRVKIPNSIPRRSKAVKKLVDTQVRNPLSRFIVNSELTSQGSSASSKGRQQSTHPQNQLKLTFSILSPFST